MPATKKAASADAAGAFLIPQSTAYARILQLRGLLCPNVQAPFRDVRGTRPRRAPDAPWRFASLRSLRARVGVAEALGQPPEPRGWLELTPQKPPRAPLDQTQSPGMSRLQGTLP